LHLYGVAVFDAARFGETLDRTLARVAGAGGMLLHARGLEQQSLANPVCGDDDTRRVESREHFGNHRETGDDDVGASGVEPLNGESLGERHVLQRIEDVLELDTRDACAVHRASGVQALSGERHAGKVGERSAGSHDTGAAPFARRQVRSEHGAHVATEGFDRSAARALLEVFLR